MTHSNIGLSRNRYVCKAHTLVGQPPLQNLASSTPPPSHHEDDPEISFRKVRDDGEIQHVLVCAQTLLNTPHDLWMDGPIDTDQMGTLPAAE